MGVKAITGERGINSGDLTQWGKRVSDRGYWLMEGAALAEVLKH